MIEYRYNVTEYDPERAWIVLSSSKGREFGRGLDVESTSSIRLA